MFSNPSGVFFGGNAFSFDGRKNAPFIRTTAAVTCLFVAWMFFPRGVFAKKDEYKPKSQLAAKGLTQTPDAKLRAKIDAREAAERAATSKPRGDVEPLSASEMKGILGRGAFRNPYFNGTMPWQRSFHDVNLCNGNLFKSFTDVQVAPGRGAGLVLQRTYNSNDDRQGPFGTGWTHAYDIRMEEAGTQTDANTGVTSELVPRTDFFGGKHKYTRDADGLYSPPGYLYDEMDSRYDASLTDGAIRSLEDSDKGMDGTVKHFIPEGADANGKATTTRVCDTITDRYGNQSVLTYGQSYTNADGSTHKLLTQVTDPVKRSLQFVWNDFGTGASHAWRIIEVDSPTYRVTYDYYQNAGDTSSYLNLKAVHTDTDGLNRTMTYTYTTCQGETGLLASIADPLGHTVSYQYIYAYTDSNGNAVNQTPTNSVWVSGITEPAGVDSNNNGRLLTWTVSPNVGNSWYALGVKLTNNAVDPNQGSLIVYVDSSLRVQQVSDCKWGGYSSSYDIANNVIQSKQWHGYSQPYVGVNVPIANSDGTSRYNDFGITINAKYGPHGNVLKQYNEGDPGSVSTYSYYDASKYFQKSSVTDALGHTSNFDYFDANDPTPGDRGNVKRVQDAGYNVPGSPSYGKQFTYTYNQYGQKASETNLNGVTTNYTYGDSYGNLTQVVQDPTGVNRVTRMTYDGVGRVKSSTDPNGNTSNFVYNNLGQPLSATFLATNGAVDETVSYTYGTNGRTESVTDGRGTTLMTYEAGSDRVSSVTDPVTGATGYTYTPMGSRRSMTLPGGGTVTYKYVSDLGTPVPWVLGKDDPNAVSERLSSITDDQNRSVYVSMDQLGLLYGAYFNVTYNSSGSIAAYCKTAYTYDRTPQSNFDYSLGSRGRLIELMTTYTAVSKGNSTLLNQNDYTYNANGQRTTNTITTPNAQGTPVARTETYTYDELSRLKTASYGDGENQSYTFDAMGNRTAKTDNVTGNEGYTFDNANRIATRQVAASPVSNYTSDANGNTLQDGSGVGSRTNVWDSQNRLLTCAKQTDARGTQQVSAFKYGADGLRRRMQTWTNLVATQIQFHAGNKASGVGAAKNDIGDAHVRHHTLRQDGTLIDNDGGTLTPGQEMYIGTVTHYGYDGSNVVREWNEQQVGTLTIAATYFMGPSGPMYRRPANAADVHWYVYDGLGSVVGEVDVNGILCCQKTTDVYGIARGNVGTALSRHGFVGGLGHYSDSETGLVYMRARYYDSAVGRFISQDPAKSGANWFTYCENEPINRVDATGNVSVGLVELFSGMLAMCGIALSAGELVALLKANSVIFGVLLFSVYLSALKAAQTDYEFLAFNAYVGRFNAEQLGMGVEAALFARIEAQSRGRATLCRITAALLPVVWMLSWGEGDPSQSDPSNAM